MTTSTYLRTDWVPVSAHPTMAERFLARPFSEPEASMDYFRWVDYQDLIDFTQFETELDNRNQPAALADFACDHIDCHKPASYAMWDGCFCLEHA